MSKSAEDRFGERIIRNSYIGNNKYGIPSIKKEIIEGIEGAPLVSCKNMSKVEEDWGIHFFVDDKYLDRFYNDAEKDFYLFTFAKARFVLTPDFSVFPEMPLAVQCFNVFRNRYCGACWQDKNIHIIPTVGWADERSYDFTFLGIEKGSIIALSTKGIKKSLAAKKMFMEGLDECVKKIEPSNIICHADPFDELRNKYKDLLIVKKYLTLKGGKITWGAEDKVLTRAIGK